METEYQVIPIFSTPLYVNNVPEQLVLDHIKLLDNEKIVGEKEGISAKENGNRSLNTYILNQPQYQNLSNYILQHAINFAENYMNYNYKNYKFSQSWISIKQPNQSHLPHEHPYSLVSGILFYGEDTEDTSCIKFHRNDEYIKNFLSHKLKKSIGFVYPTYDIVYKPNLLVIFPSYLIHSVDENITNIPRKSLAFNVIPRDGFGKEEALCELKFN